MHRKLVRWPLYALLVALATGIVACGEEPGGGGALTPEDFPPTVEAPSDAQEGGTLEVLSTGDVDYIDPGAMYYSFSYMVGYAIHRPLYSWQPADVQLPSPDLAEGEAEISSDGKTVTITIRDGVRFSPPVDREVTSDDVKYAIERSLMPGVANGYVEAYFSALVGFEEAQKAAEDAKAAPDIKGIETPDDKTIVFRLDEPEPVASVLVQALSLPISAPVPEEYAKEFDAETPSKYGMNQVATGPYMIENDESGELTGYSPGKEIHLVRNPNWDGATDYRPAYLDEIQVTEGFTDTASASRRILEGDGQVNGDFSPPPAVLKQVATETPEVLELAVGGGNRYISLNTQIPPFDDINVRKAVLAAADREALRLTRGGELLGPIATHFIPPDVPGFEEAGGLEGAGLDFLADPNGDQELAAEYMRKAGFESGKYEGNEEILMVAEDAGIDRKTAEVALDLFEGLGFKVDFQPVTQDVMYTRFCNVPKEEVHVCPNVGWVKDFNDAQTILDPTFNGDNILPTNNSNWPQLDVPEINKAMEEAKKINDPAERAQAWGEIDTMVTEQAAAVPWIWDYLANIRSDNVNGVVNKFNASWDLTFTSVDQGQ
jgi:peptide/nickel transport system substrate-binding protein